MTYRFQSQVLAFCRACVGFLFACHGAASLFGVLGGAAPHGGTVPAGSWPGWYAAVIQLVGGTLVALGLFTVPTSLLCSGSMAYAYFVVHQPTALFPIMNRGEPAGMFSLVFLAFAVLGSGPYSLDRLAFSRRGLTGVPATSTA